jgi:NTP pyrophosphatase (non-canonical NTP hydrolase)
MGRRAIEDLALTDLLERLAAEMRANSERWFPRWHSPFLGMPLRVAYALGLVGEAGEVANVVKKVQRDGDAYDGEGLGPELADVLTYLLLLADEAGVDLVAEYRAKAAVNEARWG